MTSKSIHRFALAGSLALIGMLVIRSTAASDWPQFRGPDRSGVSAEKGLLKSWPPSGPRLLWKGVGLGEAHAAPSVAAGRVYGMGLRGNDEVVWALDEKSGKPVWSTRIAPLTMLGGQQGGNGPRCTPTVVGARLYAEGVGGEIVCMNTLNGRIVWHRNLAREFGGQVPQWGYSESPLVDGNRVVVTPGGSAATLVALNTANGAEVWRSRVPQGDGAAYSSPIAANVDGRRLVIQLLTGGVVGVDANSGGMLWRYDPPANRVANCASPIYRDHLVFAATGYGTGGGCARLARSGAGVSAREVYFTRSMKNHHGGVVLVGDYLYGFDDSNLTCIEFKTGRVAWSNRSVGKGSVTSADGCLYVRSERGTVALVEANPQRYVERSHFEQPFRTNAPAWPYPVVSNGRLYLRDQDVMLCYAVGAAAPAR